MDTFTPKYQIDEVIAFKQGIGTILEVHIEKDIHQDTIFTYLVSLAGGDNLVKERDVFCRYEEAQERDD